MPSILSAEELQPGDILLKWLSDNPAPLSKVIAANQKIIVKVTTGNSAAFYRQHFGVDPTRFTHAALAYTNGDIMEYDEGSGILEIMKFKGEGCVMMPANDPRRAGIKYMVFRCNRPELAQRAVNNMQEVYCNWEGQKTSSYGIRKLATTIWYKRGSHIDQAKLDSVLRKIRGEQHSWWRTNRQNFFCSQFASFVYMWAAHELAEGDSEKHGASDAFGIDQARISPAELASRLLQSPNFDVVGEFAP